MNVQTDIRADSALTERLGDGDDALEVATERPQALEQRFERRASAGFARVEVHAVGTAHDSERNAGSSSAPEPMFDVVVPELEHGAQTVGRRPKIDRQQVK